jgi:bacteriocin-like protein
MKTLNIQNALVFQKTIVAELTDHKMQAIIGGTSDQNDIVDTCTISIICQTKDW